MTGTLDAVIRFGPAALLSGTVAWLAVATRLTARRLGRPAYGFGGSRRQRTAQLLFRASVGGGLAATVAHALGAAAGPFAPLAGETSAVGAAGFAVAACGAALVTAAQATMGRNWRVGVADRRPDALVTTGLFGLSRNPVFLGMTATAVGLAVVVPSPTTLAAAAAFALACELQVRDEERALATAFGEAYAEYRRSVRRWI